MKWIKIEENTELPREAKQVLVWNRDPENPAIYLAWLDEGRWEIDGDLLLENVTHFMELPPAPPGEE